MKHLALLLWTSVAVVLSDTDRAPIDGFRPPSVPLFTMDPYISLWSNYDNGYDGPPKYWNGSPKNIRIAFKVDDDSYMAIGDISSLPLTKAKQTSVKVWPTRTIYEFQDPSSKVKLSVQLTTPLLPRQWDISSRPVTYVSHKVYSMDGNVHHVQLFFQALDDASFNSNSEKITWNRFSVLTKDSVVNAMKVGTVSQTYFSSLKYDAYINWGYAYVAFEEDESAYTSIENYYAPMVDFVYMEQMPRVDYTSAPVSSDGDIALNVAWEGTVDEFTTLTKFVVFVYDDYYSVNYFGQPLQPLWRRPEAGVDFKQLLRSAIDDYELVLGACEEFDTALVRQLEVKGGAQYATLASLAYRQTLAATKLVWNEKVQSRWAFLRSVSTEVDMSPVDSIAAASPLFLSQDPEVLLMLLMPVLAYANNETGNSTYNYPYPWAPHHLGTYPNARILAVEQDQMPMEETGNVFILLAATTQKLGHAATSSWYPKYWPLLKTWADFLVTTLPDPGDQNSTDSFEGPTPHNANLAIKGIVGLGAFGQLCHAVGKHQDGVHYHQLAVGFAKQWVELAREDDHYKLAFNESDTWSLKYNLFYEKLLGLELFPKEVVPQELNYYLNNHWNTYGIPLDNRVTYTKLDWMALVAALSENPAQRQDMFGVLYNWTDTTTARTPLTDWYDTLTGEQQGYTARPVVGALYGLMVI